MKRHAIDPLSFVLGAFFLIVGLVFGRRYCLPCLAYFELVQPEISWNVESRESFL